MKVAIRVCDLKYLPANEQISEAPNLHAKVKHHIGKFRYSHASDLCRTDNITCIDTA